MSLSQEARGALLDDPALFMTHYFSHKIKRFEDFHYRLIDTATQRRLGLILYPAQHGKTTIVSTLLPIYEACKDPDIQIGIIAKNNSEGSGISSAIQAELITNTELIHDFGSFKPTADHKPWAAEKMTIEQRQSIAKEPTFAFFGSQSKHTLGHRTHLTICDDVVTAENSNTVDQRGKMRGWFNKSVRTMNLPGGRTTVVGTLFDPADLYNDLLEVINPDTGLPIWHVQREDAIVDEDEHRTLWPEVWPWPALMELKAEMGTLDFNKRLRNIAVDESRMVFREEFVKGGWIGKQHYDGCLDKNYLVGEYEPGWKRVAGFDPAVGRSRSAKFCAHLALGLGSCPKHDRCFWVIDLHRAQMTLPQQCDHILSRHQELNLMKSMVEANSFQAGLYQELQRRMIESGVALQIEPHYTTKSTKPDPELGVQAMGATFENGLVHIPWGNPESRRKMQTFVDELVQYPGRTTDTVMAFWFAWKNLQESAPKYKSGNYLRKPGSGWTSLGNRRRVQHNPYYASRRVDD